MASIDINADYKKLQTEVESTKSYKDLKKQYDKSSKYAGDLFGPKLDSVSKSINEFSGKTKAYQKKVKSQFEHLLDVNTSTGSNSLQYIKKKLIQTVKTSESKIAEILFEEILTAIGCDQQQTFVADVPILISVGSVDLGGILKIDPSSKTGKLLYEKKTLAYQSKPFSMNKGLYNVTQSSNPYSVDNSAFYSGNSNQNLFDIQYLDLNPVTGAGGGWFKVTPKARIANINLTDVNQNLVGQFIQDYYKTIKLFDGHNVYAWLIDFLTGAISIKRNESDAQIGDKAWLTLKIQRILGLCFDNRTEIDVSGNAKVSPSDGLDESFYELDSVELREIEQKIVNVKKGVIDFVDCDTVQVPVNTEGLLDELDKMTYVKDDDFTKIAEQLSANVLKPNAPNKPGFDFIDKDFIKQLINGLVGALLSPKVLLPIYVMIKAIGKQIDDSINTFEKFCKYFKTFSINLISKIAAIFIKELFNIIKKDIRNLILSVIRDITIEKSSKKTKLILKLTKIFLAVAELYKLVTDWRKCKSIVDELLNLIQLFKTRNQNLNEIPFPLLYTARLLDGYSETRAFIGTIEELQKIGVPTGPMPDGSPNLTVLSMFSQLKASASEENLNGKVEVAIGPLTITPSGFTVPASAAGKKF
jgi:hypothetical protein